MIPHSEAAERNKKAILEVLRCYLAPGAQVLEIGCGTGQHAEYFASQLPEITWMPSDRPESLPLSEERLRQAQLPKLVLPARAIDVSRLQWPAGPVGSVFTANTLHIMSWEEVEVLFFEVSRVLLRGGYFLTYGPFNEAGTFTSASNEAFDQSLRARDPSMGVRDIDDLLVLAQTCGLLLQAKHSLPANNQILVWVHVD
jgi:cyclopropane fatty-acyl-phospholipid synthase-like methyltransferase